MTVDGHEDEWIHSDKLNGRIDGRKKSDGRTD